MDNELKQPTKKVAFYLRVSTEDQSEKYGLPAQRSAVEAVLKLKIDELVFAGENYVYLDSITGTSNISERPAFAKLQEDFLNAPVGNKPFDIVAVFKIDRFARKLKILMDTLDFFEKNGISFISATESIDTTTPFGRAMIGILGVIAELERENILERTRKGKEEAFKRGVVMGANTAYGYKKDEYGRHSILEQEANVVRKIFNLFVTNGLSPQKIADILKEQQILSPEASAIYYGKRKGEVRKKNEFEFWRLETVRAVLEDQVYIGKYYRNKTKNGIRLEQSKWELSLYRHEPIIPEQLFKLAQMRLKDISARKTLNNRTENSHLYLLRGLLKCHTCRNLGAEESEVSWTGSKDRLSKHPVRYSYSYRCNRTNRKKFSSVCPVIPIPADQLENYIVNFIKQLLQDPKSAFEHQKKLNSTNLNIKQLTQERKVYLDLSNGLPQRKKNILEQHESSAFDKTVLDEKLKDLGDKEKFYLEKIQDIDLKLSQEELSKGYEDGLEMYAKKYKKGLEASFEDKEEVYELIHGLISQIVVSARPKTKKDVIGGKPKENQFIPNKIDIYLNLPQQLLQELITHKFSVKSANV